MPWRRLGRGAAPALAAGGAALASRLGGPPGAEGRPRPARAEEVPAARRPLRVAFLGNSYQYFNDLPRLFQQLCAHHGVQVETNDCFRGGSSWTTLLRDGSDMIKKFATPPALRPDGTYDVGEPTVQALLKAPEGWDFAVMNTYSQEPARQRRGESSAAVEELAALLLEARARPVLLVTAAYRLQTKGSEVIGTWEEFTWKQSQGMLDNAARFVELCPSQQPRTAEANCAFAVVHGERPELWYRLFYKDHFHPSALGSFLQACTVFCAIFQEVPALPPSVLEEPGQLYARARRMLPPPDVGPMPTAEELLYLRGVAARVACADALMGLRTASVA